MFIQSPLVLERTRSPMRIFICCRLCNRYITLTVTYLLQLPKRETQTIRGIKKTI